MSIEFLDSISIVGDVSASQNVYAQNLSATQNIFASGLTATQDISAQGYYYGWGDYLRYHLVPWPTGPSGAQKYHALIGNAVDTEYTVVHNLSSEEITVSIYDATTKALVFTYVEILDDLSIKVSFHDPPSVDGYKVVVLS